MGSDVIYIDISVKSRKCLTKNAYTSPHLRLVTYYDLVVVRSLSEPQKLVAMGLVADQAVQQSRLRRGTRPKQAWKRVSDRDMLSLRKVCTHSAGFCDCRIPYYTVYEALG